MTQRIRRSSLVPHHDGTGIQYTNLVEALFELDISHIMNTKAVNLKTSVNATLDDKRKHAVRNVL